MARGRKCGISLAVAPEPRSEGARYSGGPACGECQVAGTESNPAGSYGPTRCENGSDSAQVGSVPGSVPIAPRLASDRGFIEEFVRIPDGPNAGQPLILAVMDAARGLRHP